jgi:ferrous iron transport protein B
MKKKIILMGNPNVGKSVVFSRLTGTNVISSNYPGTTVDFSKGKMKIKQETAELIDAPGTYSLDPQNKSEEVASKICGEADIIINVVDATNLERNLNLTLEILEKDKPTVIALNLWDEAQHLGIHIDDRQLEKLLGVPVIPTVALTGEGIKELVSRLNEAKSPQHIKPTSTEGRWIEIGHIITKVERVDHRHHTIRDRLSDLTLKPMTGLPIAIAIVFSAFWVVRYIGEALIAYLFEPLFEQLYLPLITSFGEYLGDGILYKLLISQTYGDIVFEESLGMLTTGLFVPIGIVFPYIIAFYVILSLLEDSGYLPRLATLVDTVFHKIGMHGHGIITVFLGLGCNVPGMMATRSLETRKQRFIAATLLSISVPCMAQTAMIFAIFSKLGDALTYNPFIYIAIVFSVLILLYFIVGFLLNKLVKGGSPEIFLEIPSYRVPHMPTMVKKTWMRIRWFLKDALPWMFFGVFLINVLYTVGFIDWFAELFRPVMQGLFGLPGETSIVLLSGFLRKDLAVGTLLSFPTNTFTAMQLVIVATMLTIYFPCAATFVVFFKELGIKDMLKSISIMGVTAIIVGVIMRLILLGV